MAGVGRSGSGAAVAVFAALALVPATPALAGEGDLSFMQAFTDGVGGVDGLAGAGGVAISPNGDNVYVAGRFDGAVTSFTRDPVTGALTPVDVDKDGVGPVTALAGARRVAVSPDGENVYVTGEDDDAITTFDRSPADGSLTFREVDLDAPALGLDRPIGLTISEDGRFVYVAGEFDNAITVFSRDQSTGALSFSSVVRNTDPGVSGLAGAVGVAITPDQEHLYAASYSGSSLTAWSRDTSTGALSFIESKTNGVGGVSGILGGDGPAISADGRFVYASGDVSDSLATFSRNPSTGALGFIDSKVDGVGGVDGLNGATLIAISPDQKQLYAPGEFDNALALFDRLPAAGTLAFRGAIFDSSPGVDGLAGAEGVAVSADGRNVYVGSNVNQVAVFARVPDTTAPETVITAGPGAATSDATPSFGFSSPDPFVAGFDCALDGGPFEPCSLAGGHTTPALGDGAHAFAVRAVDTAGNPDPTPAIRPFAVDTTAPDAQLTVQPKNRVLTAKRKVKVGYAWTADERGSSFRCALDRAPLAPCATSATLKVKAKAGKGKKHTFRVEATDAVGNVDPTPVTDSFRAKLR
jgi:6-phosphogluconolactonase (cycloisomerase 2 family)